MANNSETQDIVILQQLRAVAEAIEKCNMLARCVNVDDANAWSDYYCLQNEFLDRATEEQEKLRVMLITHVLPFVRDMKAVKLG